MTGSPARIWFVLAGIFAVVTVGAWLAGQAVTSAGIDVVAVSSAAFTLGCTLLGVVTAVAARARRGARGPRRDVGRRDGGRH